MCVGGSVCEGCGCCVHFGCFVWRRRIEVWIIYSSAVSGLSLDEKEMFSCLDEKKSTGSGRKKQKNEECSMNPREREKYTPIVVPATPSLFGLVTPRRFWLHLGLNFRLHYTVRIEQQKRLVVGHSCRGQAVTLCSFYKCITSFTNHTNMAAVSFLQVLSMQCPELMKHDGKGMAAARALSISWEQLMELSHQ